MASLPGVNRTSHSEVDKLSVLVGTPRRGRDQRLVSRCRVEFERPSGTVVAETEDLSPRGLYIRTEDLLSVGDEADLQLTLPEGDVLALYARVAHVLTPTAALALGRHAGMGFELLGADTPARVKLRAYVDRLRAEITNPGLGQTTQIIVVEPAAPMRSRIARCLESAGFKVNAVADVPDAFEACTVWRPDTIVAAASIGAMSGIDLAMAMADNDALSDVPLILTGTDGDLGRLEAFRAGVRDYIPQPFLDEELVIRVHRVAAPPPPSAVGLRGSLVDITLGTLLSLFEFERKSGVLLLLGGGEIARVFLAEGRCVKVEASAKNGALRARDKLMRLLDWKEGQFEFSPMAIGGRDEIGVTTTALLLEHARRSDEMPSSTPRPK
jgi:CheY-like chemotaxis protein/Tfp pilus assembly protein PilZ